MGDLMKEEKKEEEEEEEISIKDVKPKVSMTNSDEYHDQHQDHKIIVPFTPLENDSNDDINDDDIEVTDGRRTSISMSESMSMSTMMSLQQIPSNIPRKSFKQINYNWNDSISKKSFNNYKKLREKFAFRYKHTPRKTKDEELIKVQEKLFTEAIEQIEQNEHNEQQQKQEEKQDNIK